MRWGWVGGGCRKRKRGCGKGALSVAKAGLCPPSLRPFVTVEAVLGCGFSLPDVRCLRLIDYAGGVCCAGDDVCRVC